MLACVCVNVYIWCFVNGVALNAACATAIVTVAVKRKIYLLWSKRRKSVRERERGKKLENVHDRLNNYFLISVKFNLISSYTDWFQYLSNDSHRLYKKQTNKQNITQRPIYCIKEYIRIFFAQINKNKTPYNNNF